MLNAPIALVLLFLPCFLLPLSLSTPSGGGETTVEASSSCALLPGLDQYLPRLLSIAERCRNDTVRGGGGGGGGGGLGFLFCVSDERAALDPFLADCAARGAFADALGTAEHPASLGSPGIKTRDDQLKLIVAALHTAFEVCPHCSFAQANVHKAPQAHGGQQTGQATGISQYLQTYETFEFRQLALSRLRATIAVGGNPHPWWDPPTDTSMHIVSIGVAIHTLQIEHRARAWALEHGRTLKWTTVEYDPRRSEIFGGSPHPESNGLNMDVANLGLEPHHTDIVAEASVDILLSYGVLYRGTPAAREGTLGTDLLRAAKRVLRRGGILLLHIGSNWLSCIFGRNKENDCKVNARLQQMIDDARMLGAEGMQDGFFAGFARVHDVKAERLAWQYASLTGDSVPRMGLFVLRKL
jgi:hypothetical protein